MPQGLARHPRDTHVSLGEPSMPAYSRPTSSTARDATGAVGRAFLNVRDAAEYLGLSPHTLYVWRHRRQGPPSFRMGQCGRVMYRIEALNEWIREQEQADSRSNTSLNPVNAAPRRRSRPPATV
ncbi:helix-turn-helix domain-containing protein [Streptomyces erythrochromogenes]|uniref:helix-turn-helix domain-containing protein n=1 Tax=Streptomyces erythrochromogenes TaxID=285574 RepID=UPI003696DB91